MNGQILYQHVARIGLAASNPHRLRALNLLAQSEKSVDVLADLLGLSLAATSAHLKVLRSACLVDSRKEGRNVFYRLADESVGSLLLSLRRTGERLLPEIREVVRDYHEDRDAMSQLIGEELLKRVRSGAVTLIDLRPDMEYRAGHFPGARSVPVDQLEQFIGSAGKRKPIVAYCRGPYCVAALEGVTRLREAKLNATRLEWGVLEWREAGLPLERENAA